jgi:hypothetical protein
MRFFRFSVFAIATIGGVSVASATCTQSGPSYRPEQNDSTNNEMTCSMEETGDVTGTGHLRNEPGPGYVFTGIYVVSKPHNGTLKVWGKSSYEYTPEAKGTDSFSFKLCATLNDTQSGCTTMNYSVTIN